jgi:predicted PurR-regulated permease PerM
MSQSEPSNSNGPRPVAVVRTALIVGAIVVLALLAWQLSQVLLLGFAAVLVAIILRSLAGIFESYTPIKAPWSLLLSTLLIGSIVAGFAVLLGAQIAAQFSTVVEEIPGMLMKLGDQIGIDNLNERLAERMEDYTPRAGLVGQIAGYTSLVVAAVVNTLLVIAAGIYLASQPDRYRTGVLKLVPERNQKKVGSTLDNAGRALRLWLFGQLVLMIVVGVLVTIGLHLIGMPSALALGFLAGVSNFVPLVGPVFSAIPAVLLALTEGGTTVFWVIGLYLLVQQIESNIVMPLIQRKAVDLPPVLTLFAILAFGILFGPIGVLLSTPLTVFLFVAVKQLYVREALGGETEVPGESR